jgi:hypothetical protein
VSSSLSSSLPSRGDDARTTGPLTWGWPRPMHDALRAIGVDLAAAETAADDDDGVGVLHAVRMIQGRATVTRALLERTLGQDAAASEPTLARVVREIRGLISDREVNSLPPDELRARMRAVLDVVDHELRVMLAPPDEPPIP